VRVLRIALTALAVALLLVTAPVGKPSADQVAATEFSVPRYYGMRLAMLRISQLNKQGERNGESESSAPTGGHCFDQTKEVAADRWHRGHRTSDI